MSPKFKVILNQENDQEGFKDFFRMKNQTVWDWYPDIKDESDIDQIVNQAYSNHRLDSTVVWFKSHNNTLSKIANTLSEVLDEGWQGIDEITIIPSVCPVCPRFIKKSSYFSHYRLDHQETLCIAAHEMTHFLYFKKLQRLLGEEIDTEYPGKDWLISEIVDPVITSDPRIQAITHIKDQAYLPDQDLSAEKVKAVQDLWSGDILKFRKEAFGLLNEN